MGEQSIVCWGVGEDGQVGSCSTDEICGQAAPPAGTFRQIDAGSLHSCGLRLDGTVECWGANDYGQSDAPTGTFEQVAAGTWCSCGIRPCGAVECWGQECPASLPGQSYAQESLGENHLCGLTEDGLVVCS